MCPYFYKKLKWLECLWWHLVWLVLSLSTEGLKSSLPVYAFSINIPVYRIDFKSATDIAEYSQDARPGPEPSLGDQSGQPIATEWRQQAKTRIIYNIS